MPRVSVTPILDWGFGIVHIAETVPKKVEVYISSVKVVSPEVRLYSYKSASRPGIYYCCHLGKVQKQIGLFRIAEVTLATSLESVLVSFLCIIIEDILLN